VTNPPREDSRRRINRLPGRRSITGVWLIGAAAISAAIGCSRDPGKDVPQLIEDLRQTDSAARYTAVKTLGDRGPGAKDAVPAMIAMLKDSDSAVRIGTAYALAKVGSAAAAAVPALTAALDDRHKDVRQAAAYSLPALGPDAATASPMLQKLAAQDADPSVRKEAAKSLVKIQTVLKYRHATDGHTAAQAPAGRP
jgi:HEAT repeat protein